MSCLAGKRREWAGEAGDEGLKEEWAASRQRPTRRLGSDLLAGEIAGQPGQPLFLAADGANQMRRLLGQNAVAGEVELAAPLARSVSINT